MDRVHISGPWNRSKRGGPWTPGPCFVLSPGNLRTIDDFRGIRRRIGGWVGIGGGVGR